MRRIWSRVFFEGGEIHLSEIACEQIFLEIPYQPLCQEDCKGLCPQCGRDLNLSSAIASRRSGDRGSPPFKSETGSFWRRVTESLG